MTFLFPPWCSFVSSGELGGINGGGIESCFNFNRPDILGLNIQEKY